MMEYDGMDVEHDVVVILGIRMGTLFGRSTVEDRFKHGRKDQELVQSCISFLAQEETGIRREFSDDEDLLMPTNHAHEALALPKPSDMVVHTF